MDPKAWIERAVKKLMIWRRSSQSDERAADEPALRAQLDEASRLVAGDFSVPVPAGATVYSEAHPRYAAGPDGAIEVEFSVRGTVAALRALYVRWARTEGWQLEVSEQEEFTFRGDVVAAVASGLRVAKESRRFEIVLGPWVAGEVIVHFQFNLPEVVYERGKGETPPPLPAVTRPLPAAALETDLLDAPRALACDRGLVYVSDGDRIRVVDPTTRRRWRLAGGGDDPAGEARPESVSMNGASALVVDEAGLWIVERSRGTLRRLVFASDTVSTVARDLGRPTHVALTDGQLYVVGERGNLVVVDPAGTSRVVLDDGALAGIDRGWEVEGFASVGGSLYAAEGSGFVRAIDRATGRVRKLAETPLRPRGLTADGDALYVGHTGAITRIGVADGKVEQIAGLPRHRCEKIDGREGVGGIHLAHSLAWDGTGGVYFIDEGALRWLDLRRRFLVTVLDAKRDLAPIERTAGAP